ncbi:hypothetical protein Pyn_09028 [Prunus yedoensis var. nudiflora]|uniref:Uncharacterized protein n=2 Tax=Prunus TaxID=3754 RepID=A0A314YI14_PRUYE|nr:hypothetical protein PRUPE_3G074000 [Prunus persica]PQP98934.1 hypothetical protein Pyn_12526 [Prunus yedoensis var. nudiflora]PQQ05710.1 hypothetical protein Pyn_09028 [Prunus yedoensis var. nudiflora]
MAGECMRSALVTLFIFAMVLSPILTSEAARFTFPDTTPICPDCVCCAPPPPGYCCDCNCAAPIKTHTDE